MGCCYRPEPLELTPDCPHLENRPSARQCWSATDQNPSLAAAASRSYRLEPYGVRWRFGLLGRHLPGQWDTSTTRINLHVTISYHQPIFTVVRSTRAGSRCHDGTASSDFTIYLYSRATYFSCLSTCERIWCIARSKSFLGKLSVGGAENARDEKQDIFTEILVQVHQV
jgi:hypothetical protein